MKMLNFELYDQNDKITPKKAGGKKLSLFDRILPGEKTSKC